MSPTSYEVNFDGLIGPTHNYAGLSIGNIASMENAGSRSYPKKAALEGLNKMKFLADLGFKQAILPPHERPHLPTLRALGYSGSGNRIPEKVYKDDPELLFQYSSAAPMFAANAAIVTPSIDASNNRVHITPSNKLSMPHRAIEAEMTARLLKAIFSSSVFFTHHPPLPNNPLFLDEGAANHIRFSADPQSMGVNLFVYGKSGKMEDTLIEMTYPPRQTLEAQQAIVRSHQIPESQVVYAMQSKEAINRGVFHNDVISMGTHELFIYHEHAFENSSDVIAQLSDKFLELCSKTLSTIAVANKEIPLSTAVKTYFFNSQLLKLPDGGFVLFSPLECQKNNAVSTYIQRQIKDPESPIADVHYIKLEQSMQSGGGPACMRLPIVLTDTEIEHVNQNVFLTNKRYERLKEWIETHYREELKPKDLADPDLVEETQAALSELTQILDLGRIYEFQR